ncbi:hypothetical protein Taro_048936 [Colocasia esculenta]|uniref:Uncharacterized protein n=1 Tax=Colocasia esculenta TaxID=4460 RepID=A0A843X9J5_COLES|nr:hypothetical protein [Colocasia esculenta]
MLAVISNIPMHNFLQVHTLLRGTTLPLLPRLLLPVHTPLRGTAADS